MCSIAPTRFRCCIICIVNYLYQLISICLDNLTGDDGVVKKVNFDFLVNDVLLRSPLDVHLSQKDVSSESVVVIEYMKALPPPEPADCLIHDDWVSSIHCKGSWYVISIYFTFFCV